jgi:chromosome segregation ATPase
MEWEKIILGGYSALTTIIGLYFGYKKFIAKESKAEKLTDLEVMIGDREDQRVDLKAALREYKRLLLDERKRCDERIEKLESDVKDLRHNNDSQRAELMEATGMMERASGMLKEVEDQRNEYRTELLELRNRFARLQAEFVELSARFPKDTGG